MNRRRTAICAGFAGASNGALPAGEEFPRETRKMLVSLVDRGNTERRLDECTRGMRRIGK
jgi:hypothetical protein